MKVGDKIRFNLAKKQIDGVLLESHDKSVYLIKLDSGYNIGLPKENVYGTRVLKSYKKSDEEFEIPKPKKKLKNIGLIVTGGTIASKLDSKTGGVTALSDVGEFAKFYPELFEKVNVVKIDAPFMKAGENVMSDDWKVLAESVGKMLKDKNVEGIVVTHGTDTLHYTSAALSFMLGRVGKPVVMAYSQRSIDRGSSDARLNLLCAAEFALSNCAEVVVVGHANIDDEFCYALRGTKCRKLHTSRRDAFKPVNVSPIAKVTPGAVEFLSDYNARSDVKVELDNDFSKKVALVKYYPGMDEDILDYYKVKGYKGIVIEVLGIGNLPGPEMNHSWTSKIKKLVESGVSVCAVAQTVYGRLHPKVYSPGRALEKAGVIFLEDMLAETAYVKLGWVLSKRISTSKVKERMLENISGELNKLISE